MEEDVAHELLHARVHGQRTRQADAAGVEDSTAGRPLPIGDVAATVLPAAVPLDIALPHGAREEHLAGERLVEQASLLGCGIELVTARAGSIEVRLADRAERGDWHRQRFVEQ